MPRLGLGSKFLYVPSFFTLTLTLTQNFYMYVIFIYVNCLKFFCLKFFISFIKVSYFNCLIIYVKYMLIVSRGSLHIGRICTCLWHCFWLWFWDCLHSTVAISFGSQLPSQDSSQVGFEPVTLPSVSLVSPHWATESWLDVVDFLCLLIAKTAGTNDKSWPIIGTKRADAWL